MTEPWDNLSTELGKLNKTIKGRFGQTKRLLHMMDSLTVKLGGITGAIYGSVSAANNLQKQFLRTGLDVSKVTKQLGNAMSNTRMGFTIAMQEHAANLQEGLNGMQDSLMELTTQARFTGQDSMEHRRVLLKLVSQGGLSLQAMDNLAFDIRYTSLAYRTQTQTLIDTISSLEDKLPVLKLTNMTETAAKGMAILSARFPAMSEVLKSVGNILLGGSEKDLRTRTILGVQYANAALLQAKTGEEFASIIMQATKDASKNISLATGHLAKDSFQISRVLEAYGGDQIVAFNQLATATGGLERQIGKVNVDKLSQFTRLFEIQASRIAAPIVQGISTYFDRALKGLNDTVTGIWETIKSNGPAILEQAKKAVLILGGMKLASIVGSVASAQAAAGGLAAGGLLGRKGTIVSSGLKSLLKGGLMAFLFGGAAAGSLLAGFKLSGTGEEPVPWLAAQKRRIETWFEAGKHRDHILKSVIAATPEHRRQYIESISDPEERREFIQQLEKMTKVLERLSDGIHPPGTQKRFREMKNGGPWFYK